MIQTVSVLLAVVALTRGSIPHASVSTQYHAQDELGQYSYGYAGGPSSKAETKTADGVVRGEYSYIDANGIIQTAHYIADPHHGFRVVASNDPSGPLAHSVVAHAAPAPHAVAVAHPAPAPHALPVAHAAPAPHAIPVAHAAHAVPVAHHAAPYPVAHRRYPTVYEAGLIPGVDTPEVQVARAAHLHAVAETKARDALVNHYAYPQGASYVPYAAAHSHYSHYLPVQVKDTPEVAAAKAAHFAAVHEAKARIAHARSSYAYGHQQAHYGSYYPYAAAHSYHVPVPVTDTPEVAAAKAAHYAAVHEAKSKAYHASYHGTHYPAYLSYAASHSYHVPVPVKDTPEVAAAKAAHYAAVHETKARDAAYAHHGHSGYAYPYAPLPVTDTPEVAHAKAAHLAAVHHTKAAHAYNYHW